MDEDIFWGSDPRTFSATQIKSMDMAQYAVYRDRLLAAVQAMTDAERLQATNISIAGNGPADQTMTCMWCAAPYPTMQELEDHEAECDSGPA